MRGILKTIGWVMLAVAIAFVAFAFSHPEASFPWSNSITYTIYRLYAITMVVFILIPRKK